MGTFQRNSPMWGKACEVCSEGVAAADSRGQRDDKPINISCVPQKDGQAFEAPGALEIKQTSDFLFLSPFPFF